VPDVMPLNVVMFVQAALRNNIYWFFLASLKDLLGGF
jgi:hypothetical protein